MVPVSGFSSSKINSPPIQYKSTNPQIINSLSLAIPNSRRTKVYGNIGRVRPCFRAKHRSEFVKVWEFVRSYSAYKTNANLYSSCVQNCSFQSRSYSTTYYAQNVWKRFSRACSYSAPFLPLTTISCAVGLAFARTHLLGLDKYAYYTKGFALRRVWAGEQSHYLPIMSDLYTPQHVERARGTSIISSVFDHLRLYMRAIYLAILFSPAIAMSPFIDAFGVGFRKKWYILLVVSLEKAGPAFITWGRWAATRPDLFPRDLCIQLSKLQNKAQAHSFSHTKKAVEKAFGRKLSELFDDFEGAPVASGIIVQVHRATLRSLYPGKQIKPIAVAIKVRHPRVEEFFKRDFAIIRSFLNCFGLISALGGLNLDEVLQQFEVSMKSEVDLTRRAMLLDHFNYKFEDFKDVSFPKPLHPLVHPAVLVETYEKGEFLSRFVNHEIEMQGKTRRAVVRAGTRAFLNMLADDINQDVVHGKDLDRDMSMKNISMRNAPLVVSSRLSLVDHSIHAGMHPGSILIRLCTNKPHIIFLDVGIPAEFSLHEGNDFVRLFEAVGVRDGQTAAECTLRLSKKQNCPCPNAFITDVKDSFDFWNSKESCFISSLDCMYRLLEKVRTHNVSIDQNIASMITSVLTLEEWQRKLSPESRQTAMQSLDPFRAPWTQAGIRFLESEN